MGISHDTFRFWYSIGIHRTKFLSEKVTSIDLCIEKELLICGTNYGYIKVYSYPAVDEGIRCSRHVAHAGGIRQLTYVSDAATIVSIGNFDKCILQWCYMRELESREEVQPHSKSSAMEAQQGRQLFDERVPAFGKALISRITGDPYTSDLDSDMKSLLKSSVVTDNWIGSMAVPSSPPALKKDVPDMSICLDHVYGFSCSKMRNNVHFTANNDVVYVAGCFGIVANRESRSQRFFRCHSDLITAFAVADDGKYAATGEIGRDTRVYIWSTIDCTVLAVLPDDFSGSISCLSFSADAVLLAVASTDVNNTVTLYDWKHTRSHRVYSGEYPLFSIVFNDDANGAMCCCSSSSISLFSITARGISPAKVAAALSSISGTILCCSFFQRQYAIGCSDGYIHSVATAGELHRSMKAFPGGVESLFATRCGDYIASGSSRGQIKIWSNTFECIHELSIDSIIKTSIVGICAIAISRNNEFIVVGTRGGNILTMKLAEMDQHISVTITEGHCCEELSAVAAHPTKSVFASTGDDSMLRFYDATSCDVMRNMKLDAPSRALAFSNDGKYLALG